MNVLLSGYGQIGKLLEQTIATSEDFSLVGIVDYRGETSYKTFKDCTTIPDVIIDFSHPSQLDGLLQFAIQNNTPLVIGTTNFSTEQISAIQVAAQSIPILHTSNTSIGVQALLGAVQVLQQQLPNADIEITETHHKYKQDAPSGTANMIVNTLEDAPLVYGRKGVQPRQEREIGVHSVRGGSVVGTHEVSFFLNNEVVTITHKAQSKQVFVNGALVCARYITAQLPGYYTMNDVTKES